MCAALLPGQLCCSAAESSSPLISTAEVGAAVYEPTSGRNRLQNQRGAKGICELGFKTRLCQPLLVRVRLLAFMRMLLNQPFCRKSIALDPKQRIMAAFVKCPAENLREDWNTTPDWIRNARQKGRGDVRAA
jgi:hypothetical protein